MPIIQEEDGTFSSLELLSLSVFDAEGKPVEAYRKIPVRPQDVVRSVVDLQEQLDDAKTKKAAIEDLKGGPISDEAVAEAELEQVENEK